jgi:hypothetical protein
MFYSRGEPFHGTKEQEPGQNLLDSYSIELLLLAVTSMLLHHREGNKSQ